MKIGIDIDGVLINLEEVLINYAPKFCYDNRIDYKIDVSKYDEAEMLGLSDNEVNVFWNKYLGEYVKYSSLRIFAKEVIDKLKEKHQIYIITSRNEDGLPSELYGTMQEMTIDWLKKNEITYNEIIFNSEKTKVCKEKEIDIMIEDKPNYIKSISNNNKVICFDASYNRNVEGENIIRAYSWYDVLNKIEDME